MTFEVREADFDDPRLAALVALHLEGMHAHSPPGHVFALDDSGLRSPEVTLLIAWRGKRIAGMGALKDLGDSAGEIKSMRTHPDFLGQGVARAILERLIEEAVARGWSRLSLETGSGAAFEPAIHLYRGRGFVGGEAFAPYIKSDFNQFFHLPLSRAKPQGT